MDSARRLVASWTMAAAVLACACGAMAANPWRADVAFAVTNDCGVGKAWYAVGGHPDLGNWDPAKAVLLGWHEGNVWSATVGLQATASQVEYKFVKRSTAANAVLDGNNAEWWPAGDNLVAAIPAGEEAPVRGKKVVFLGDWEEPVELVYSTLSGPDYASTGTWASVRMEKVAEGRYEARGVGEEGAWMRFTISGRLGGQTVWQHAWGTQDEDFWTPLDALVVRDGEVFNYEPAASLDAPCIVTNRDIASSWSEIPGYRDVRIYLPRGYAQQTNRSYPVVYFSDGQCVFDPSTGYGCWYAEHVASAEIRAGRMREAILVGVPCRSGTIGGADGRTVEYLPPTDSYSGARGRAGDYANYLVHNVRPTIDARYRTRNGYADTAHIGSSSGGLLSMWLGTHTNVFGLVGAMSGVYNAEFCPNYLRDLEAAPRKAGMRLWMDTGTGETSIEGLDLYASNFDIYTLLVWGGHVPNKDLRMAIGSGAAGQHDEASWNARLPEVFRFLLDIRDEANGVADLAIEGAAPVGDAAAELSFPVVAGAAYSVEAATDLLHPSWTAVANWPRETQWGRRNVRVEAAPPATFFRLRRD